MKIAKQKTTIIFLDNGKSIRDPILVPTFFLKNWKFIAFGFFTLLGIGIFTTILIGKQYLYPQQQQLAASLKKNKRATEAVKEQYDLMGKQIAAVNKLLMSKGIKPTRTKNAGGPEDLNFSLTEENRISLESYLNNFKSTLAHTPIGYPIDGKITSRFGYRENPFNGQSIEPHKGLDLKGSYGTLVKCKADGKVVFAGNRAGFGNLVVINHQQGLETYYGHLSKILVKQGQSIKTNTIIGKVGSTGRSTGPHLHYEIHKNGKIINPKSFLTLN